MNLTSLAATKLPGLLHPGYGYVLLVVLATYILSFAQAMAVSRMRKRYQVDYPAMYSDTETVFNCYQNLLERIPLFLCLLLSAGLFNSIAAKLRNHISLYVFIEHFYRICLQLGDMPSQFW